VLGRIEESINMLNIFEPRERLRLSLYTAEELLDEEKFDDFFRLASLILSDSSFQGNSLYRSSEFDRSTYVLIRAGRLNEAMQIIEDITDDEIRSSYSLQACRGLVESGQKEEAKRFFAIAEATARRIEEADERSFRLATLADLLSRIDQSDNTKAFLHETLQYAAKINNDERRSEAIARIAQGFARLHLYRLARLTCDRCSSVDKLNVYSVILTEYSKARGGKL
jgi:hypothetical protein